MAKAKAIKVDEMNEAVEALRVAKAVTEATEAETVNVHTMAEVQAKQLLERIAAEKAAKADEPSGVEAGVDWNFIKEDVYDHKPILARRNIAENPDHRYHWINRDPRRVERRLNQGWLPVQGGSVTRGESMLASMPEAKAKRIDQMQRERTKNAQTAHIEVLHAEGNRQGMEVFDVSRSKSGKLD